MHIRSLPAAALLSSLVSVSAFAQSTQPKVKDSDWPMFSRDLAGTRYSPLTQINTKNVSKLTKAWSYSLRADGETRAAAPSEVTPIVVNGVMYLAAGNRVIALEPETGKELWSYTSTGPGLSRRGVAYWPGDQNNPPRIIFTIGRNMMALNANTGKVDPGFGKEGTVDLVIPYQSAPTVYKNVLFVGANVGEIQVGNQPGNTRAYDARTGAKLWEFHNVPMPGETGNETWKGDGWKDRTGANNWGFFMTVDQERGILYMTLGSPASDFYGFDREGNDLFGNSLVALDAETGKLKWFFQAVHHDLWDFDLPPAPGLVDVVINGKKTPILAQTGKVGYMYILNRVTGEPIFGIKETPVPQSTVPGEHSAPTQPIPVKPPEIAKHSFNPATDIVTAADTNEEHAKACADLIAKSGKLYNEGPFTPWARHEADEPQVSTVMFPGAIGGSNWGGTATDPRLGYVFVNTNEYGSLGWVEKQKEGAQVPYQQASVLGSPFNSKFWDRKVDARGRLMGESSWPCQKPPWGMLTAVNLKTGDFAWRVPLGVTDELPEGKRNTGRINLGGPIVTAGGIVFIGATNDRRFRAIDSRTGKELWVTRLDYSANAVPMTFLGKNGKQYVAIAVTGGGAGITNPNPANTESLQVFALP
jgi:glucose dehydrogenase